MTICARCGWSGKADDLAGSCGMDRCWVTDFADTQDGSVPPHGQALASDRSLKLVAVTFAALALAIFAVAGVAAWLPACRL